MALIKRGAWKLKLRQMGIALKDIEEGKFGSALFEKVPGSGKYFDFEVKAIKSVREYHEIMVVDSNNGVIEYALPPEVGVPIAKLDRYTGIDTDYKTVVSWTVSTAKRGDLKEVSMITDNYSKTHFKLTIAGKEQFKDKLIQAPLSLPFPENRAILAGQTVLLECKSTDGTSITVDGSITGCEF